MTSNANAAGMPLITPIMNVDEPGKDFLIKVGMKKSLLERGTEVFWNGAVRNLLRNDPEVCD